MWTHLFTLQVLAKELTKRVAGTSVTEVYTQQKDELLISTRHPQGVEQTLVISVNPQLNFTFVRDKLPRARKNSVDLFRETIDQRIIEVSAHPTERTLFIKLAGGLTFCVRLFGTAESNVFLVDEDWNITNAFKNRKRFEGKNPEESARPGATIPSDVEKLSTALREKDVPLFTSLKKAVPILGSTYAREILHRLGLDEKLPPGQLRPDDIRRLHEELLHLIQETKHPVPTVYLRNDEPRVFSIVPLRHLSGARTEPHDSVNTAIRSTVFRSLRSREVEDSKASIIRRLKAEHDRTLRAKAAAQEELSHAGRSETYERAASLVMANIAHLTKGTKFAELDDIFSDKQHRMRIDLDPKLTPVQNAEQYFSKARKARAARTELQRRVEELSEKSSRLDRLLLHIDQCQTREQLEEFQRENSLILRQLKIGTGNSPDKQPPFRVFTVKGDFEVWVGKNSANNDLLTMKHSQPQDLWFHARGAGGSHTVLKVPRGKEMPSKETISQAASIAAYYSKMRKASAVSVAYCERKYVKKPKGAETGAVIMNREKVIFVEPRLP